MVNNSTNINKQTTTSHLNSLDTQKKRKRYVTFKRNPSYGLGHAQKYGGVKPVNEIPPLDNWISNDIYIYKQTII